MGFLKYMCQSVFGGKVFQSFCITCWYCKCFTVKIFEPFNACSAVDINAVLFNHAKIQTSNHAIRRNRCWSDFGGAFASILYRQFTRLLSGTTPRARYHHRPIGNDNLQTWARAWARKKFVECDRDLSKYNRHHALFLLQRQTAIRTNQPTFISTSQGPFPSLGKSLGNPSSSWIPRATPWLPAVLNICERRG